MEKEQINNLITLCGKGDEAAMEKLYTGVGKLIYTFVLSYVKSKETAEDVMQETFLKLFTKPKTMTDKDNGLAYIMTIARNVSLNVIRKNKRQIPSSDEELVFFGGQDVKPIEEKSVLKEALAILSDEERRVLVLSQAYGFTFEEVSKIMGTSVATVKRRSKAAKDKLNEFENL